MYYKTLVSIKNYKEEKRKDSPRAQTTHLTSFGPIFIVATLVMVVVKLVMVMVIVTVCGDGSVMTVVA